MAALGLLVLRLSLATLLATHGAHELFGAFAGPAVGPGGLSHTAAHFRSIGLNPGLAIALLSGLVQLAGGVLIAVGYGTRGVALAVIAYFGVEIWKEQACWGFFLNWMADPARGNGIELSVVMIGALLCLVLGGAGDWSVDGRRARHVASRAAGRARLRRQ